MSPARWTIPARPSDAAPCPDQARLATGIAAIRARIVIPVPRNAQGVRTAAHNIVSANIRASRAQPTGVSVNIIMTEAWSTSFNATPSIAATARTKLKPLSTMPNPANTVRTEEHTYELQSLMHTSYAVVRLQKKNQDDPH